MKNEQTYVIQKDGAYYRQNALGYTYNLAEAGTFTFEEAKSHLKASGVTASPLKDALHKIDEARTSLKKQEEALDLLERVALGLK